MGLMKAKSHNPFGGDIRLITALTTQQKSAKSQFDKDFPQICPKGLNMCIVQFVGGYVCISDCT